ncbi:C-C chemokine receptor type 10 [Clupea harengus]|uniref:C-C chemokine receptor type 10 n=1 Tax=Clupea harengus TaxID=7950 RepID=A0A6P8EMR4_CLUHA|nr:C-C chemokine receptor type 10 [Clupea harengus]
MAPEDNYDNVTLSGYPTIRDVLDDYDDYFNFTSAGDEYLFTPCFDGDDDSTLAGWQTVFYILVFLLGIMGNSLVVATFARYWRTRLRSLTDAFLLHLALSDLQLLLTLPLQAWEALRGEWPLSGALCKLTKGLWSVNTYSGLLLLACISAERYSVVVHRSGASRRGKSGGVCCHRPMRLQAVAACLSVALAAVALSVPDFMFSEVELNSRMCGLNVWVKGAAPHVKMMLSGSMIAGFCVPFAVMATCYTAIGRVLAQGHKQAHSRGHGQSWRRQRTLRLMVALVLLFLLFQLPYTLVLGLKLAVSWRSCALLLGESVTRSLAYTRCCLNPILYALVGVRFRNDVLRLLRDAGCLCLSPLLTPDPDSGSSVSPPPTMSMQLSPKSPTPLLTPLNIATPTCQRKVFVYPPLSSHHT